MTTEKKLAILGIAAFCGLVLLMIWMHGTVENINDSPVYGKLVGTKYETKIELYFLQYRQTADYYVKVPGWGYPEVARIKEYPYGTAHAIIHKLIPAGTRFTITNIVVEKVPFRGSDLDLQARFDDQNIFKGEFRVNTISDFDNYHAKMNPQYVREISAEGEPSHEE